MKIQYWSLVDRLAIDAVALDLTLNVDVRVRSKKCRIERQKSE